MSIIAIIRILGHYCSWWLPVLIITHDGFLFFIIRMSILEWLTMMMVVAADYCLHRKIFRERKTTTANCQDYIFLEFCEWNMLFGILYVYIYICTYLYIHDIYIYIHNIHRQLIPIFGTKQTFSHNMVDLSSQKPSASIRHARTSAKPLATPSYRPSGDLMMFPCLIARGHITHHGFVVIFEVSFPLMFLPMVQGNVPTSCFWDRCYWQRAIRVLLFGSESPTA